MDSISMANMQDPLTVLIEGLLFMNFGGYGEDIHGPLYIFCLLFKKTEKVQEHDQYLNQILHHFDLNIFFLGSIIKKLRTGGRGGPTQIS